MKVFFCLFIDFQRFELRYKGIHYFGCVCVVYLNFSEHKLMAIHLRPIGFLRTTPYGIHRVNVFAFHHRIAEKRSQFLSETYL